MPETGCRYEKVEVVDELSCPPQGCAKFAKYARDFGVYVENGHVQQEGIQPTAMVFLIRVPVDAFVEFGNRDNGHENACGFNQDEAINVGSATQMVNYDIGIGEIRCHSTGSGRLARWRRR